MRNRLTGWSLADSPVTGHRRVSNEVTKCHHGPRKQSVLSIQNIVPVTITCSCFSIRRFPHCEEQTGSRSLSVIEYEYTRLSTSAIFWRTRLSFALAMTDTQLSSFFSRYIPRRSRARSIIAAACIIARHARAVACSSEKKQICIRINPSDSTVSPRLTLSSSPSLAPRLARRRRWTPSFRRGDSRWIDIA
jgi:hypothetical protein